MKNVESELKTSLETEENLENLKEILHAKKYTKRKKSLLKKQISDLNKKIGSDLPKITEEKVERFGGLNARDQRFIKPPETLKPSRTKNILSLEIAAVGENELRAGGEDGEGWRRS